MVELSILFKNQWRCFHQKYLKNQMDWRLSMNTKKLQKHEHFWLVTRTRMYHMPKWLSAECRRILCKEICYCKGDWKKKLISQTINQKIRPQDWLQQTQRNTQCKRSLRSQMFTMNLTIEGTKMFNIYCWCRSFRTVKW